MKKVVTFVGTRPELIRLSEILKKLDRYFDHKFVHTGQNFDVSLHHQFFSDLDIRQPDYQFNLEDQASGMKFIGQMLVNIEGVLTKEKPDVALILGDTNSALAAYVCKQMGVPVFHMEAGNRCYSDKVPEEVNRRVIDTCSEFLLTYTQRSREQLLREGYHPSRVIVTGNPITEVLKKRLELVSSQSQAILGRYSLKAGSYLVSTLHRTENVTNREALTSIMAAFNKISEKIEVVLSVHPKLRSMLDKYGIELAPNIRALKPFNFSDFVVLMKHASVVISDSGTVPEEACTLGVPCVLIRDTTERPELLENNSMLLSGTSTQDILGCIEIARTTPVGKQPYDYVDEDVSDKIIKLLARAI